MMAHPFRRHRVGALDDDRLHGLLSSAYNFLYAHLVPNPTKHAYGFSCLRVFR